MEDHQLTQESGTGSSESPPNVSSQQGGEGPSSARQQRMQQAPPPVTNYPSISPQTAQQMKIYASSLFQSSRGAVSQPNDSITRRLEDEVNNLKGIADRLLSELADSKSRILILEADVKSLKGSNDGLQPELSFSLPEAELGMSSEKQIATDDISCSSDDGLIRPIPAVDAEVASDMRAWSGPGFTSGNDDESEEPVTIAAGGWLSAAYTDRNKATTESDELQGAKVENVSTFHDDISCSSDDGQVRLIPSVDAEVSSDMRARSDPGSTSGNDDESEGPATIAAGDGLSAANTDIISKANTESDESQDDAKAKNANTSQDDST